MAEKCLHLNRIRVPIILVQGNWDRVSDSRKITALIEEKSILKTHLFKDCPLLSPYIAEKQVASKYLFPQSPYVRIVKVEKFGVHLLPFYRSNSIARVTFYLLRRY